MALKDHFEQRKIEATYGSFRSHVPLRFPSGPQSVESELEAELLEQLAFSAATYDLMTQPVINYLVDGKARRYTPDIVVELYLDGGTSPRRYIIEVKRAEDLARNAEKYAVKFEIGRMCASEMSAAFRIMTEDEIRTPYLRNARLLSRHLVEEYDVDLFYLIRASLETKPLTVGALVASLIGQGIVQPDARTAVEEAVAYRWILCDLARPFDDATTVRPRPTHLDPMHAPDPILKTLLDARSGVNI